VEERRDLLCKDGIRGKKTDRFNQLGLICNSLDATDNSYGTKDTGVLGNDTSGSIFRWVFPSGFVNYVTFQNVGGDRIGRISIGCGM
jgi:hypothetical protein